MSVYLGTEKISVYTGGIISKPEEEKTVTAGTSVIEVNPSSGKVMKKVTVNPTPTEEEIRMGISGNICRCTGYDLIVDSILIAAKIGEEIWKN